MIDRPYSSRIPTRLFLAGLLVLGGLASRAMAQSPLVLESPGGKVRVELTVDAESRLSYRATLDGREMVAPSRIGIVADGADLSQNVHLGKPQSTDINETYPIFGVHAQATNRCRQWTIPVERSGGEGYQLDVRAYDDGVALRCRLAAKSGRHIDGEVTQWRLPARSKLWFQDDLHSHEGTYTSTLVEWLTPGQKIALPATAALPDGGYVMITEANVIGYTDLAIQAGSDQSLKALFHADPKGWSTDAEVVQPWRVAILARDLNVLVNSDILRSLCPPPSSELANAGWIKPGRAVWQWWSSGAPKLDEQRQWVDWTRQLGFEYYLIDDGWKRWKDGDKDGWACLADVVNYANTAGVKVWLWANSREVAESATRKPYFENAKKAGIAGVKIDFMPVPSRHCVDWYDETLRDAAALQLMVDFHGATKPSGRDRTWPNEMTREGIRGHEWHILRYQRMLPPAHDCAIPFIRNAQGSADYTPTVFNPWELRGNTWPRELAQAIVFTSPFLCYADHPRNYIENPAKDVLCAIPSTWDETIVLPGSEIGQCAAFARRKGPIWFIGVINGPAVTKLDLPLSFLGDGSFQMTSLEDHPSRDDGWNRQEKPVKASDRVKLSIRPAGGFVARITRP